ncbi:PRC-barrel domain-containing protein [Amycolatopsis sp. cmx-4-68]|uniref:PRC-barrel domain-containing protein n=1 Tax=Amycolatopsis sp. cmx-4-68 TaxID=2790938 RepID=UPI00397A2A12
MNPWDDIHPIDLGDALLDRQITGEDGTVVGKVDDLELRAEGGTLVVDALLVGPEALADRIGGPVGKLLRRIGRGFRTQAPQRIPLNAIRRVEPTVVVTTAVAQATTSPSQDWLRRRIVDRIPGAGRAGR